MTLSAWSAQLKEFSTTNEDKKILLHFTFSAPVVVDDEYYYDKNLVLLRIQGVSFTRDQLKHGYQAPVELADYLREVTYQQDKSEGQIRIYLGKLANPSDALVIKLDDRVDIELVKPTWKEPSPAAEPAPEPEIEPEAEPTPPAEEPTAEPAPTENTPPIDATFRGDQGEPEPEFIPDEPAAESEPAPAAEPAGEPTDLPEEWSWGPGTEETPAPEAASTQPAEEPVAEGEPAPAEEPVAAPADIYGETSITELPGTADSQPAVATPEDGAETRPVRDVTQSEDTPYTEFNLDQISVVQVVIRSQPFREAILELVGGCGFNVVVGDDVDNTVLALDFRNREISLKRALEILCMAYDLEYTVDADAIIFRAKP